MQIFTIFYADGLNTSADLWQYERDEEDLVIHPVTQVEVAAELCSNRNQQLFINCCLEIKPCWGTYNKDCCDLREIYNMLVIANLSPVNPAQIKHRGWIRRMFFVPER